MKTRSGPRGRVVAAAVAFFCAGLGIGWWLHAGPPAPAIRSDAIVVGGDEATISAAPRSALSSVERPAVHPPARSPDTAAAPAASSASAPPSAVATAGSSSALDELHDRHLRLPIDGTNIDVLKGGFDERRGGGRPHEAVDMLAPRNTPIYAVEDGTIAKLFFSEAGGNTIYQYDPLGRFCYYYAHLERYADGLSDGSKVSRGDVIGFVGTSGNAPPATPHLHFAVFELTADRRWWHGKAIDPYQILH